jgi:hypothetical protein
MIAESTTSIASHDALSTDALARTGQPLSLNRIVATLQVVLASRRAARSEEYAYWYNVARGL